MVRESTSQKLQFKALDIETINTIAKWVYKETETSLYMKPYQESYLVTPHNIKGPGGCDGYGVYLDNVLFGLFEYKLVDGELEIGCAIAPFFKSKGCGEEFVKEGIEFGISKYHYTGERILLNVDIANIAAIKVYKKVGFSIYKSIKETIWMCKGL